MPQIRLLGLLLAALPLAAQADSPLPIAFDSGNPPAMWGEGRQVRGIHPALVNAAAQASGLAVQLQGMPWPRAMAALAEGKSCVGGAYANAERLARYQFSAAFWEERVVAVMTADAPSRELRKAEDLKPLRIGLHRGWSYGEELDRVLAQPGYQITRMTFGNRLFLALEAGKFDVVLTDGDSAVVESRRVRRPLAVRGTLSRNSTHVICPPRPTFGAALQRLDQGLQKLRDAGQLEAIVQAQLTP
ncbi:ABC-type amino acid transport substrate-binding protein [Inhella inkyongensis]|uniref:ABC-type amino acid transport substrate-binding protein n=1 Tax=Inhella inkyongensis TaxID=392593 RepID=A0A840SBB5_9BURK|nr:transporter substrate-binding domain-containing protein [Inhella inkyongensis]MBB5205640.1 ABC-type amino acid transport substrate-binding protein [Inhella inkyongensis]